MKRVLARLTPLLAATAAVFAVLVVPLMYHV